MKKIILAISVGILMSVTACSDNSNPSKESGDEQVPAPVPNSGVPTEAERATNAIKDSTNRNDSTRRADSTHHR